MTIHAITVLPVGISFDCSDDEPILEAAIRAGLVLPYGCRKGNCGTCKAQILDGDADLEIESAYSISESEREQGFTLLCSAYAASDVTVEMEGLDLDEVVGGHPPRQILGTVADIVELTHDMRRLSIELDEDLSFKAGQFAEVNAPGTDIWRSYSMANPPSSARRAEFMIKLVPGGEFSGRLEDCRGGERIALRAPHGSFWVRDHGRPLLLIGGGAGMAPLWAIIQDLAERGDPRPVRFFYGARTEADLFQVQQVNDTGGRLSQFAFVPALSDPTGPLPRGCEQGLITDVVERVCGDQIRDYDAYLCGPPPMIDAALEMLEGYKLEERHSIFYDKFSPS